MSGYTKTHRKIFKHPLFASQKFCRGFAWEWLLANAVHSPLKIEVKGKIIELQRGQLSYSIRYLAEAWNWDKAAVSRFIARLKTETMIKTQTETGQLVITICNYNEYQGEPENGDTAENDGFETEVRQQRDRSETNKKNDKNDKKDISCDEADLFSANSRPPKPKLEDEFREFWKAYPKRTGGNPSKPAFEKFKAARKKAPLAEIMAGVKSLAASRQGEDPKFTPMAATWLNQERWKDAPAPKQGGGILDRIRMEQDQQRRAMERGLA